jgi:hypothetical protein
VYTCGQSRNDLNSSHCVHPGFRLTDIVKQSGVWYHMQCKQEKLAVRMFGSSHIASALHSEIHTLSDRHKYEKSQIYEFNYYKS